MTADEFVKTIGKFAAVRTSAGVRACCPIHQFGEDDSEKWSLAISPGDSYPLLLFCHKCCVKGDVRVNREYVNNVCGVMGIPYVQLAVKQETKHIEAMWSQIGVMASKDRPLPAPAPILHAVYSDLLGELTLTDRHARWLEKRGLNSEWAYGAGYRSTPDDPDNVAKRLWSRWDYRLATVPGFSSVFSEAQVKLLTRRQAVLTPCRDTEGRVLALKQRLIDGGKGRLRLLSSSPDGGPKAVTLCHVPLGLGSHQWGELWVTEGERKADVHFTRTGIPTVAIPGTGNWATAIPCVTSLLLPGGGLVTALDQDGKPQTRLAQEQLMGWARGPKKWGRRVASWPGVKGLDDGVTKGVEVRVGEWVEGKGREIAIPSSPTSSATTTATAPLRDWMILDFIRENGPVHRCDLPLHCKPVQDRMISDWIRTGAIRIAAKTPKGQLLEAT